MYKQFRKAIRKPFEIRQKAWEKKWVKIENIRELAKDIWVYKWVRSKHFHFCWFLPNSINSNSLEPWSRRKESRIYQHRYSSLQKSKKLKSTALSTDVIKYSWTKFSSKNTWNHMQKNYSSAQKKPARKALLTNPSYKDISLSIQ